MQFKTQELMCYLECTAYSTKPPEKENDQPVIQGLLAQWEKNCYLY